MKKIGVFLIAVLSALSAWGGAECVWLNPEYDFGAFNEDLGSVECVFKGVNTGNEPLIIMAARANCGCTVPAYEKKPIEPGDTVHIKVKYNASGRPGRFDKKIYIYTNTIKDRYTLTIKGTVIGAQNTIKSRYPVEAGPIRLGSDIVPMGEVMEKHVVSSSLRAYNASDSVITPELAELPEYFSYEVLPPSVNPGEQFTITLRAFSAKCPDYGLVTDTLYLIPDNKSQSRVPLTTIFTIKEDFSKMTEKDRKKAPVISLDQETIDFGTISRENGTISNTVNIWNRGGGNPLFIRRAFTPAKGVDLKIDTNKKGIRNNNSAPLTVTVDPDQLENEDILNARITLITNDPENPTKIIRVIGQIK